MSNSQFEIEILEQGWLEGVDPKYDLCSHGKIRLVIGGQIISSGEMEYGIIESALTLLRTLNSNHNKANPVAERLITHGCGAILMINCPIGIDWQVTHTPQGVRIDNVIKYDETSERLGIKYEGLETYISKEEYRKQIYEFAFKARKFYHESPRLFNNDFDKKFYKEFWEEYNSLLALQNRPEMHFSESVTRYIRKDFISLDFALTAGQAIDIIRKQSESSTINYFYVTDAEGHLAGVLNTRQLLVADPDSPISGIMKSGIITIAEGALVSEACGLFLEHKLLALPVVDGERKIVGIIDVNIFTKEMLDLAEQKSINDIFETIGYRVSELQNATKLKIFRLRFPWLFATITSGFVTAIMASLFEATLAAFVFISFFLTLVLALGESISIQSMTVTIQNLHFKRPTGRWFLAAIGKETLTALMLGLACGGLVGAVVYLWLGQIDPALVIGVTIVLSFVTAAGLGLTIPTILHAYKLDLKIAAGPVTLAITDILTVIFYFSIARLILV